MTLDVQNKLISVKSISDRTAEQRLGAMRKTGDFIAMLDARGMRKRFEQNETLVKRGQWLVAEDSDVFRLAEEYFSAPRQGPRS